MTRLRKLLLVLFGVALALGIGIAGLYLLGQEAVLAPCQPEGGDWAEMVTSLVRLYRRPCDDFFWLPDPGDEFHNRIRLNNFGLHDTSLSLDKPGGVYRVLVVGDSYPQGWQVPLEEGFPWLMEQALSRDSGRPVEAINLSVDAFGTDRELLLYSVLGWRFQPDLVLLVMYAGNDIQDNQIDLETRRYGYRQERPFFTLDGNILVLHNSTILNPNRFDNAPVYRWLTDLQTRQLPAPPDNLPAVPRVTSIAPYTLEYPVELGLYLPEDAYWSNAWTLSEALIVQFRTMVELQGSRFAVAIIPDRRAVHNEDWTATIAQYPFLSGADPTAPLTRLEDFLIAQNIPTLNLVWNLRAWLSRNPGGRLYYGGDGHFNANGHAVTAQRISGWLRIEGLAP